MSKRVKKLVQLSRIDKDKNGRPIPIYKITRIEKSQLMHDVETGKKTISKVKL